MLTVAELQGLLPRLDGAPADDLESENLEFKSWQPHGRAYKEQLRKIRETVVAFANARGGLLVLGVEDRNRSRAEAIHGVGSLDENRLRRDIYDGTDPHILVEVEPLSEPEGRLLVIRVPAGIPPHTTTDGVGRIRVGKENKPLTGANLARLVVSRGQRDLTAEVLPGAKPSDLDPDQIRLLRMTVEADPEPLHPSGLDGQRRLAALSDTDLLEALGLTSGNEITMAAMLLVGRKPMLAQYAPRHELIFSYRRESTRNDLRRDLRGPLLQTLEEIQRLLSANLRMETVDPRGFAQLEIPDMTWWVAREAVLNALVHRDYFVNQSIHMDLYDDRVEVISPGGFIGGITERNILRHPPVRRNPLLADVLQTIRLVNRQGLGVDRIFEELLLLGKNPPRYQADESHVKLVLPTRTHAEFARFVYEMNRKGETLRLDDLMVLRGLLRHRSLDRWSAADLLQLPEEDASARLVSLRHRGFIVAQGRGRGTSYRLARRHAELLESDDMSGEGVWMDEEYVRLRVLAILFERSRLTNAEIRRITGYTRFQVLRLMGALRQEGHAEVKGRGRGAHYVPVGEYSHASRSGSKGGSMGIRPEV